MALVLPGIPGGAGAGIKALRGADKAVDAAKTIKTEERISKGGKTIHENFKASKKAQHNYDVINTQDGNKIVKKGVSGGKVTKGDESYRG
ncbi:MAG: hypothetical protein ACLSC9_11180 [Barnesiella sp.]